ncbi:MAG: universal stress protein [Pirellulales bacterium]
MSGILVAIDGSPNSEKALETAVRLAQQDGGRLSAVCVVDFRDTPPLAKVSQAVRDRARRQMEELLQSAANFAHSRGVALAPVLTEGHPAGAILACIEEQHHDLVVLGGRGQSDSRHGLGDTADLVSSHSRCNVLIVKACDS